MLAKMPRNGAGVSVVAAAGRRADDEADGFAAIEIRGIGSSYSAKKEQSDYIGNGEQDYLIHRFRPPVFSVDSVSPGFSFLPDDLRFMPRQKNRQFLFHGG
jgi:hypothetical protein